MNKKFLGIRTFERFLLRAPLFSLDYYFNLVNDRDDFTNKLRKIASDPVFQEAILAASTSMFESIENEISSLEDNPQKTEKINFSIFKYLTRMCSQATPFGLFAGCALGEFNNKNKILLNNVSAHHQSTRVDMGFLFKLWHERILTDELKRNLNYATNPHSFTVGDRVHFIEKQYDDSIFSYNFSSIDYTTYVQTIMEAATSGLAFKELAMLLIGDEITLAEAEQFILDLVNCHLLICVWEPSLKQSNPFDSFLNFLHEINSSAFENYATHAQQIKKIANLKIGTSIQPRLSLWKGEGIENQIQTDLYLNCLSCTLDKNYIDELTECINFLCRFCLNEESQFIKKFINRFTERYENREVPLLQVFDPDIGIFSQEYELTQEGLIIDNLNVNNDLHRKTNDHENPTTKLKRILVSNNGKEICLEKLDLSLADNLDHLPDTFSAVFHLFGSDEYKAQVFSIGHSSAVNLLSRFSHGTSEDFLRKIADYEKERNPDCILAGISHIPGNARTANVLIRPDIWDYEINYLSENILNQKTIPLSDLMVSIADDESVIIRSKSYNKRVIPKISSAINVDKNANLIFKFLTYVENQGKVTSMGLDWLIEKNPDLNSFPRISYKGIIVLPYTWRINIDDLKPFNKLGTEELLRKLKDWRESFQLPESFLLATTNGESLLITLSNYFSARLFLQTIHSQKEVIIQEFLFNQYGSLLKDKNQDSFVNQVIISIFKD